MRNLTLHLGAERRGACLCPAAVFPRVAAIVPSLCIVAVFVGCNSNGRWGGFFARGSKTDREPAIVEMGGAPVEAAALQGADWNLVPPDPKLLTDPTLPRWRHATLEPLLKLPPAERPNLAAALTLTEPVVRANAAIGLARWGDGRGYEVLVATINDRNLRLTLRQASAEALGCLTKPSPVDALRTSLDVNCRFDSGNLQTYSPELHADLLRALSRHVDAASDTHFIEGLRAPANDPRREAVAAWARSTTTEFPVAVVDLRADPTAEIRAMAVKLLLDRRHPQAIEFAQNALKDFETSVRDAAIVGLGKHGGPEARAALERVMLHEGEVLRSQAVAAFAEMGAGDAVVAAANDKAWRVRRAVAQSLAKSPDRAAAGILRTYLADDSGEVRKATVAALEAWPLETAGPVLLAALGEPTYETRRLAGEQLARRWPTAASFTPDLPPERRREMIALFEESWSTQFGAIDRTALAPISPTHYDPHVRPASAAAPLASRLTEERLEQLRKMVDDAARPGANVRSFDAFGTDVVEGLERLVIERGVVLPEAVYLQILPTKDTAFAQLEMLASKTVADRRRAADQLADTAENAPLRPLAVARLVELGQKENDGLVCRGMYAAIENDPGPQAAALAFAGLSHPSPEVRRLACAHLGRSPQTSYAVALTAALDDPHMSVKLEALNALAHTGMLAEAGPVERLLTDVDPTLRLAAARALQRNGLPQGAAALERLAHDGDPEVRRRAAAAMGDSYAAEFVPTLVKLLSDPSLGTRRAAVDNLAKLVGTDVSVVPGRPMPALDERIAAWKKWHLESTRAPDAPTP